MSGLELLLKELNPKYDMARHTDDTSFLAISKDFGIAFLNYGKSFVRGGIAGGIIGVSAGTLYSLVSGEDILNGAEYGGKIGFGLGAAGDMAQYGLRWVFQLF